MRGTSFLPVLLSVLALGACRNSGTGDNSARDSNGFKDPAMLLSREQIIETYSGVSCESLRHMIDYLDQIGSTDYFRGLSGEIRYQPQACRNRVGRWEHLDKFYTDPESVKLPNKVFLTKLDVPTRKFNLGFPKLDGSMIKTPEGADLVEFFSLQFKTELKLGPDDEEGEYELAVLADDGVRIEVGDGEGKWTYLDSPGIHATKMVCSAVSGQTITLSRNMTLPIRVRYFQGPRQDISLMLLWRKAGSTRDAHCGKMGEHAFFDDSTSPSTPKQNFRDLQDRGWSVMPAHVFRIPRDEYMNPCESEYIRDIIIENETSPTCTATTCGDIGL